MATPPLAQRTVSSRGGPWGPPGQIPGRGPPLPDPQRLGPPTMFPPLRAPRARPAPHPAPRVRASQMPGRAAPPLAQRMAQRTVNSRGGPWGPPGQVPGRGPPLPDPQRLGLPTRRRRLRASRAQPAPRPAPRVRASQAPRMAAPPPQIARWTANLGGPSVPRPEKTSPEVYPLSSCPAVRLRVVICPPAGLGYPKSRQAQPRQLPINPDPSTLSQRPSDMRAGNGRRAASERGGQGNNTG